MGQLQEYIKSIKSDFRNKSTFAQGEGPPKQNNMSEVVSYVMWGKQLKARVRRYLYLSSFFTKVFYPCVHSS